MRGFFAEEPCFVRRFFDIPPTPSSDGLSLVDHPESRISKAAHSAPWHPPSQTGRSAALIQREGRLLGLGGQLGDSGSLSSGPVQRTPPDGFGVTAPLSKDRINRCRLIVMGRFLLEERSTARLPKDPALPLHRGRDGRVRRPLHVNLLVGFRCTAVAGRC